MIKMLRLFLSRFRLPVIIILSLILVQTLSDLYLPTLMSDIVNSGVMTGDSGYILRTGLIMLLISGVGIAAAVVSSFLSSKASMGLGRDLRSMVFSRVESFSLSEFDRLGTSTLITRTTNDISQVQMVVMMITRMMLFAPLMAIGGIVLAYSKDKSLTLVLAVAVPILMLFIVIMAGKIIPLFKQIQKKIDRINLVLREKLTGVRVIRAFNAVDRERKRFDDANVDLTDLHIRVIRIMAFVMPAVMLIMNLTSLAILWFGILRIESGTMDLGSLMAFMQYAMQIMFSMLMVSMMFVMIPRAQAAAVRISEVLEIEPVIRDPENPTVNLSGRGFVEFRNVYFKYSGAEQYALEDISFQASPGETTAIIGSTGSGKSTLVNLVARFYDVESGSILVDGVDVREMAQSLLRSKIGLVPQKAILFSGSIEENIRFGSDSIGADEIHRAADTAQASSFIAEADGEFSYEIAQGGMNVSGGQKQRLAIARAIARKPEIYIFDDSFSALDFKTDLKLRTALKKETADSTVIIVAQRVGTIMNADRIIVLDKGRIVGTGTHAELLSSCRVYREIVSSQLSEEEIA